MAPLIIKARCEINVRFFPFDTQLCYLKFGSWTYDRSRLDINTTYFDITRYILITWIIKQKYSQRQKAPSPILPFSKYYPPPPF